MKVVDLTVELLRSLKVRDFEKADLGDNFIKDHEDELMSSQYKKAVLKDNEMMLAYGGKIISNQVAWVWMLGSDHIHSNPVASMEVLLELDRDAVQEAKNLGIKYFCTLNHPDYKFAIKYLQKLGYSIRDNHLCQDGKTRHLLVKEL